MATPRQKNRFSTLQKWFQVKTSSLGKSVSSIFSSLSSSTIIDPPISPLLSPSPGNSAPPPRTYSAPHSAPPSFVFFGILGIAAPLEKPNVGFMVKEYSVWLSFFWQLDGIDASRSKSNSIHPIGECFPDNRIIFGEAACERVTLPVPPCIDESNYTTLDEKTFSKVCLRDLGSTADGMKSGETLVILLIGHGGIRNTADGDEEFCFYITTEYERSGPVWITRLDLEVAVEQCKADILVICNSCKLGALRSPLWTLLCATDLIESPGSLTPSKFDSPRESAFTLSALTQVKGEQRLSFPLPQNEPRSPETLVGGTAQLPASPPTHLIPNSSPLERSESSNGPLSGFLQGMLDLERFLVTESETRFREFGSRNDVPWHRILPLVFKETFVRQFDLDPSASPGFHPAQGGTSVGTLPEEQRLPIQTIRLIADAFVKLPHSLFTREGREAKNALEFLNDVDPSRHKAKDLLYSLYPRHIQAVVVQEIARLLGWWVVSEIAPFFSIMEEGDKRHHQTAMIESGIPIKYMVSRLLRVYPGIFTVTDRASSYWLASKWAHAGSPAITLENWHNAIDTAAKLAKGKTLVTDYEDCQKLLLS